MTQSYHKLDNRVAVCFMSQSTLKSGSPSVSDCPDGVPACTLDKMYLVPNNYMTIRILNNLCLAPFPRALSGLLLPSVKLWMPLCSPDALIGDLITWKPLIATEEGPILISEDRLKGHEYDFGQQMIWTVLLKWIRTSIDIIALGLPWTVLHLSPYRRTFNNFKKIYFTLKQYFKLHGYITAHFDYIVHRYRRGSFYLMSPRWGWVPFCLVCYS